MSASDYDVELEELERRSVGRLLCAEVFDVHAFENLYQFLRQKAELVKQEHVISKQLLQCLLSAEQSIESRAQYIPEVGAHVGMAKQFAMLLHLIVAGEGCSDRTPGVPRIV